MMDAGIDPTTRDLTGTRIDTLANAVYLRLMTPLGGWWADPGMGSRLHEIKREKDLPRVTRLAEAYARNALQPLLDDGRARSIAVTARPVRGPRVVPVHRRTVVAEPVAVGDGVRDTFGLKFRGQTVADVVGEPVIHRTDWQGRVELSDQPRTNYALSFPLGSNYFRAIAGPASEDVIDPVSGLVLKQQILSPQGDGNAQVSTQPNVSLTPGSTIYVRYVFRVPLELTYNNIGCFGGGAFTTLRIKLNLLDGTWVRNIGDDNDGAVIALRQLSADTWYVAYRATVPGDTSGWIPRLLWTEAADTTTYTAYCSDPCVTIDDDGVYIPPAEAPVTVTDYTYTAPTATVITPEPLADGAMLDADFTFDWHASADIAPAGSRLLLHVDVVDAGGGRQTFEHPVEVI